MTRAERLTQALEERQADVFISAIRPNQLYFLPHPEPSSVISRANCCAIIFGLNEPVVFPSVWISNACRDLLTDCTVIENTLGDPRPEDQLLAYLRKAGLKRIIVDQPGLTEFLRGQIDGCQIGCEDLGTEIRRNKDARDLEHMREAARIADLGMRAAFAAIRPGLSCLDVIAEGEYAMLKAGAEDATMSPAVGEGTFYLDSAENPRRLIREGDMIFIDMAIHVRGYLGDMTRAGIVGEGTDEQRVLLETVQQSHAGKFDLFYLPIDFKNRCNVGYAFINFLSPAHILAFYEEFNFRKWDRFNSDKVCEIAYGRIQGKAALLTHFANSSLVHEDECYRPVVFASDGSGRRESFVGMASGLR